MDPQRSAFNIVLGNQETFLKELMSKLRYDLFTSSMNPKILWYREKRKNEGNGLNCSVLFFYINLSWKMQW